MKYLDIAGTHMPALGFGTWELRGRRCTELVRHALALGYRHIDTAPAYDNEAQVGEALADAGVPRGEVFLATKIWMDELHAAGVERSLSRSLERLRTDYLDLLLIHWPNDEVPLEETLQAMQAARTQGLVRAIGVCNFTVPLLQQAVEALGAPLACNQVEYHPFLSQRPVLEFLRARRMALVAYCPLARGKAARHPVIEDIGKRHARSAAQVTLRWLLDQEGVAAIPKSSDRERCRENLEVFDFELSEVERRALDALGGGTRLIDPSWAPRWDSP